MFNITNHPGNANQNHSEVLPHAWLEWQLSKRQEITSVGEDAKKREPTPTADENIS